MEVKHHSVAIIGGGICGMIFATGLSRRGIPFHIFEASPTPSEIGAGIALNQNGISALSKISPDLLETFNRLVTKNADPKEEDIWINFRRGDDTGELIASVRSSDDNKTGMSSVHRGQFLAALAALIPQEHITFSARLTKLEHLPSNNVRLVFENGAIEDAEVVIGCDGIRSQVRQILLGSVFGPSFTGRYAYRGLVPMEDAKATLGIYAASNSHLYCGQGGHVLTYQIDKGTTMNVVACGTMNGDWKNERWILKNDAKQMGEDFKDWGGAVKKIIDVGSLDPEHYCPFTNSSDLVGEGRGLLGLVRTSTLPHFLPRSSRPIRRRCSCINASSGSWCWPRD